MVAPEFCIFGHFDILRMQIAMKKRDLHEKGMEGNADITASVTEESDRCVTLEGEKEPFSHGTAE